MNDSRPPWWMYALIWVAALMLVNLALLMTFTVIMAARTVFLTLFGPQ